MNIPYVFKRCTKCGRYLVASSEYFYKHKRYKYGLMAECKECRKEYRKQNKEAIAEYMKEYREQNKEAKAEYMKKWYEANKETRAKYNKEYYEENKDDILEQQKEYQEQNKEAIAERRKKHYESNKETILEHQKEYQEQNKEVIAERKKKYYEANKEVIAERNKKWTQTPRGQVACFNKSNRRRAKEQNQGRGITKGQWLEMMNFFGWRCAYSGKTLTKETRSIDHIEPLNKGGVNEVWNVVPMYRAYNSSKNDKDLLEWYTEQPYFSQDRLNKIYEWQEYAFNKWGNINTKAQ